MRRTASGSEDFQEAKKMLQNMSTWSTKSPDFPNNVFLAQRIFAMLLCARFFIFKQLVQHLPVNTKVTDARRRWVFAQVLPPRLWDDGEDLFVKVLQGLRVLKLILCLISFAPYSVTSWGEKICFLWEVKHLYSP